jgi:hypothetical protein
MLGENVQLKGGDIEMAEGVLVKNGWGSFGRQYECDLRRGRAACLTAAPGSAPSVGMQVGG